MCHYKFNMAHPKAEISLEDIEISVDDAEDDINDDDIVHFITWNPNDKKLESPGHDYNNKWKLMAHWLRHLDRCCKKYCILPEVSDVGRLHCHGWLIIKDKIKWCKSVLPILSKRGFVQVTKQKHKNKGMQYYKEDLHETYEIVTCHLYPLTRYTNRDINKLIKNDIMMSNIMTKKTVEEVKKKDIESLFSMYKK